jgi:hypothetical protein
MDQFISDSFSKPHMVNIMSIIQYDRKKKLSEQQLCEALLMIVQIIIGNRNLNYEHPLLNNLILIHSDFYEYILHVSSIYEYYTDTTFVKQYDFSTTRNIKLINQGGNVTNFTKYEYMTRAYLSLTNETTIGIWECNDMIVKEHAFFYLFDALFEYFLQNYQEVDNEDYEIKVIGNLQYMSIPLVTKCAIFPTLDVSIHKFPFTFDYYRKLKDTPIGNDILQFDGYYENVYLKHYFIARNHYASASAIKIEFPIRFLVTENISVNLSPWFMFDLIWEIDSLEGGSIGGILARKTTSFTFRKSKYYIVYIIPAYPNLTSRILPASAVKLFKINKV